MAKMLSFDNGSDLDLFVERLKVGGTGGNPRNPTWRAHPSPFNGKIEVGNHFVDNPVHLQAERTGRKGASVHFPQPDVSNGLCQITMR